MTLRGFLASVRDLCLFRSGPDGLPYSPRLLVALLVACAVVQVAFELHNDARHGVVAASLLGGLAVIGTVFVVLRGRDKSERFVQTTSALAAVKLLFDLIVYPLTLLLPLKQILAHPTDPNGLTGPQTLVMLVIAALGIWQLCIWISILRRALEIPLAGGVLVFLLLLFVNWIVLALGAGVAGVA